MTNELLEAALDYAARGWPVFPLYTWRDGKCACGKDGCSSPAKHPLSALVRNGLKNATTDLDRIADWWDRYPTANIGLRTGIAFDVLDIDGAEGMESATALQDENGTLPGGPSVATGGGGHHLLYLPTGVTNRAGIVPKVDWRGREGYIVAAPSLHASGNTYQWLDDPDTPIEAVPDWLQLLLDPPKPPRQDRPAGDRSNVTYLAVPGQGTRYGIAALEAELEELGHAAEGTRNHELNAHAFNLFQLVAGDELDQGFVEEQIRQTARSIGLGDAEIDQTLGSARKAGLAAPRYAPPLPARLQATGTDGQPVPARKNNIVDLHAPRHLPEDFWEARPILGHIRQAARSRYLSPDAVLGAVLARVAAIAPHTIELPATIGTACGLTYYAALTGPPEAGKSTGVGLAAELLPAPAGVLDRLPIGSGEGMVDVLFELVDELDDNGKPKKVKKQTRHAAVFYIDEGAVLTDLGARRGSTILPTLRTAWTHGTLGNTNASLETRRILDGRSYVYGVVLGIQPEKAAELLADANAGTPQRFVWLAATDPEAPDTPPEWPGPLSWEPPTTSSLHSRLENRGGWNRHPMTLHETITNAVRTDRLAVLRETEERLELDAHRLLGRIKTAALLALLDDRMDVTEDDWHLAGMVAETSRNVRNHVVGTITTAERQRAHAEAERHSARELHVDRRREENAKASATKSVANTVRRHAKTSAHEPGCTRRCLSQAIAGKYREFVTVDEAVAVAEGEKWLEHVDGRWVPGPEQP